MRIPIMHCRVCAAELAPGESGPVCARCRAAGARLRPGWDGLETLGEDVPTRVQEGLEEPWIAEVGHRSPRLGNYELIEEIARGGMGIVYKARQRSLKRIVALKVLLPGSLGDPGRVQRFLTEAEAVAALKHPHIVGIHEIGEEDGQHFFSMEYVGGGDLARRRRSGAIGALAAARYVRKVAEAIHHAHQRGVLHRDLKPSNVLVDEHDEPKVSDFGIAKLLHEHRDLTRTSDTLGTPSFMAPEQVRAERGAVSVATDVYALGGLLYFLLTGRPPFEGDNPQQILWSVYYDEPVAPGKAGGGPVPVDLETICLKCLQKEPERRYDSALAVAEDLERFLEHRPIAARPASRLECLRLWVRRNPLLSGLSLSLVLVVAGGMLAQYAALANARRARGNAERLIEFMNEELAVRLRPLGRLDLLGEVNQKVEEYFQAEPKAASDPDLLGRVARFYQNSASLHRELGNLPKADQLARSALAMFDRLADTRPEDPAVACDRAAVRLLLFRIARLSARDGDAQVHGDAALGLLEEVRGRHPADRRGAVRLAEVLMEVGNRWLDHGDRPKADEGFVRAAVLLRDVLERDGVDREAQRLLAETHYHRGLACQRAGQPAAALEQFSQFLDELKKAGDATSPDMRWRYELAVAHGRVGEALHSLKEVSEAVAHFQHFHRIAGELVRHDAANVLWQQAWGQSLAWLGLLALQSPGEAERAGPYLVQAREVYLGLVSRNRNWESWQEHLSRVEKELAAWHEGRGEREAAERVLTEAVADRLQSARVLPNHPGRQERLSDALIALAWHHERQEGVEAAQGFLRQSMAMLPAEFPQTEGGGRWRWTLSRLHATSASLHQSRGEWRDGLRELRRALELRKALLESLPGDASIRQAVPGLFFWIAEFHVADADPAGAVAVAEEAVEWAVRSLPRGEGRTDLGRLCLALDRAGIRGDARLDSRVRRLWKRCLAEVFSEPPPAVSADLEVAGRLRQALQVPEAVSLSDPE